MAVIKTHTGVVVRATGEKRVKLHMSATVWVVKAGEQYDRVTGRRSGYGGGRAHLKLDTLKPIEGGACGKSA